MNEIKGYGKLFLELALPNEEGISREVSTDEFTGKYSCLVFLNGGSWIRPESSLGKTFNIKKEKTKGKISSLQLVGLKDKSYNNYINSEIRKNLENKPCVFTGCSSQIEIDHKNGRKNEDRVMLNEGQVLSDFQPVHRSINLIKRGVCKRCKETGLRFNATSLGYPKSVIVGAVTYTEQYGCNGCYYYDPLYFISNLGYISETEN